MGLVDYISCELQQKAVNISSYDQQLTVAKLDAITQRETFHAKYGKLYGFLGAKYAYKIGRK